jgi:hypothetical protein
VGASHSMRTCAQPVVPLQYALHPRRQTEQAAGV